MPLNAKTKKLAETWGIKIAGGKVTVDLKKIFGVDEKALIDAEASKDEVDLDIMPKPEGFTILDDDGLKGFESRIKSEAKPQMETATKEILSKIWKEKYGVKLDTKNPDEVLEAIVLAESKKAVDAAKLTVDEQVKLKETDLELLRTNYKTLETERDSFKTKAETKEKELADYKDTTEFGSLVAGKFTSLLKPGEIRQRLMEEEGITIKRVDGVWKPVDSTGNVIKNKLRNESTVNEVLAEVLVKRPEWAAQQSGGNAGGGGGKGNGTGGSGSGGNNNGGANSGDPINPAAIKNMSEFKAYADANRKEWGSGMKGIQRERQEYTKIIAENKDFDPNS